MDTLDYIDSAEAVLLLIDSHLAALPVDRNLIPLGEHVNILLDIRNILNGDIK